MQTPGGSKNAWPSVLPQFEQRASHSNPSSRLAEPLSGRHDPSRPLEPPPSRFPSLSFPPPPPSTSDSGSGSDKQRRQLPGLHELLNPRSQGETTAPGRYASQTVNTHSTPMQPDPRHHPQSRFASWSQVQSGSGAFGPSSYRSATSEHAPMVFRRDQGPPQGMPPPPPAASTMHSFARPAGPPLNAVLPFDMKSSLSRPSMAFSDPGIPDPRRDSVRSNSFAAGTAECVGQRTIPGKGLCYVYQDGNTCPTVIDGEVVNPMWGTTKAGKARKRLAQACL